MTISYVKEKISHHVVNCLNLLEEFYTEEIHVLNSLLQYSINIQILISIFIIGILSNIIYFYLSRKSNNNYLNTI